MKILRWIKKSSSEHISLQRYQHTRYTKKTDSSFLLLSVVSNENLQDKCWNTPNKFSDGSCSQHEQVKITSNPKDVCFMIRMKHMDGSVSRKNYSCNFKLIQFLVGVGVEVVMAKSFFCCCSFRFWCFIQPTMVSL